MLSTWIIDHTLPNIISFILVFILNVLWTIMLITKIIIKTCKELFLYVLAM